MRNEMKVGIDTIAIDTPRYVLPLKTLAVARGVDPDKYCVGLGQHNMSVPAPGEDIVTMAANAAKQALDDVDINDIEMLLFATESGIDQSKAAGIYVHDLLKLKARCRVVELKQACYGGTAGLQLALSFLHQYPQKKILLIASDIARYGLGTTGESSQGAAAVAMVLSANPRLLALEPEYGVAVENVMDFWRPPYLHEALVDGKYSSKLYLTSLQKVWEEYHALSGRSFNDHDYFCYHSPVPRLVEKAHQHLMKLNAYQATDEEITQQINLALAYPRALGNSYTASLYVGLASLLDLAQENLAGKRIGFYSYGSGCVAEYFSGVVQPGYKKLLNTAYHAELLASRKVLSYDEYEQFYSFRYVEDGSDQIIPAYQTGTFRVARVAEHKRFYEVCEHQASMEQYSNIIALPGIPTSSRAAKFGCGDPDSDATKIFKVHAPGKLILSGEHAVVYGAPALAMAINQYVTTSISRENLPQVLFDLADLAHQGELTFDALRRLKNRIKRKYHRFVQGDFSIREVLQKPFELAQYAMGILLDSLNLSLPHGVKIRVQSDLPIGCGMGSSAATILSVMHAVSHYLKLSLPEETLFQLALQAEKMQHGFSSGLDLRVASQGGCLYLKEQHIETRSLPEMPLYLVNTGTPISTTGQCVEKVAPHFKSSQLRDDFAAVTQAMDQALMQQSSKNLRDAVAANHRLLTHIGVVPQRVQQFIANVESLNGAAKICGAGAVAGDQAGALLVLSDNHEILSDLCHRFAYQLKPIQGETRGVHAA
ncbi:MAG: hydroxymethylglutaryl-CoA synthase [Gammaproteobacteria bacterium RIFCSPHIGHO2_12_FULL_38_14]|nr:MAG: hydroxymethylglutaryl-CoA synthase [Gammaproteobacteria bacterium RIFCSPHIGHO2_12_FULL_38_14]